MHKKLILIELNEINFDLVQQYLDSGLIDLPSMRRLAANASIRTTSEHDYEQLEPWVQWVSVHTGKPFKDHGVFRLGDITESDSLQMFEVLESRGKKIGAVSPMNASNKMKAPAYFIPDPWTKTAPDVSWWSRKLSAAIAQAVNDNAQSKLGLSSMFYLLLGLVRFARPRNYLTYLRLVLTSRKNPWKKALFLDLFLHDLHMRLLLARTPDLTVLFLNAGAHIQHHYLLSARPLRSAVRVRNPEWYVAPDADPVADMLQIYDRIVGDYLGLADWGVIIATGLSQKPYDRAKFYYRLKNHGGFLRLLGIEFRAVHPRMTRDFLIEFHDDAGAAAAEKVLAAVVVGPNRRRLFGEIDNRGESLFVTLTYPDEICSETEYLAPSGGGPLEPHVSFVAIKNGMHQDIGFAFFSEGVAPFAPADRAHVKCIHESVMAFLG